MKDKICKLSLFSAILACVSAMPADAAVKAKNSNRSYANAYQQVNAMRYSQEFADATAINATTASATNNLPVAVDDTNLANAIANNESDAPNISKLESCAMIYPNGVFKWTNPGSGRLANSAAQCVAVIELRNANSNEVLATTTLAAGDSMKCNIDYFPRSGYNMTALSQIELPADEAPTLKDVETVMNAEQKQNAGLKIVAAALVSGVAGNILAPKEAGAKDSKIPLGTGKTQLGVTALSAAAGAGVMAASTYSGKVTGDTIKSTAVNAASGMVIGNMLAGTSGGGGVLATTKCSTEFKGNKTEYDCIRGNFTQRGNSITVTDDDFYIITLNGNLRHCKKPDNKFECTVESKQLMDIKIESKNGNNKALADIKDSDYENMVRYKPSEDEKDIFEKLNYQDYSADTVFYKIASANEVSQTKHAYALFDSGTLDTKADWASLKNQAKLYSRNQDGTVGDPITIKNGEFTPAMRDADSGGLVDLSNKARTKGTVAGTAVGGALGGIAGYSGAKDEVSQRYLAAKTEYEDSLSNFVCLTGGRYLSKYNDTVEIPTLKESEEQ